jgi:hypothetical protein
MLTSPCRPAGRDRLEPPGGYLVRPLALELRKASSVNNERQLMSLLLSDQSRANRVVRNSDFMLEAE